MPIQTLSEYEAQAARAHGHLCAGQILGLRMALYGVKLLGLDDPAGADRKRLVSFVEIDRCATDAVPIVTGCRLGKRGVKFCDFGKVGGTFCEFLRGGGVRGGAEEALEERAPGSVPGMDEQKGAQMSLLRGK